MCCAVSDFILNKDEHDILNKIYVALIISLANKDFYMHKLLLQKFSTTRMNQDQEVLHRSRCLKRGETIEVNEVEVQVANLSEPQSRHESNSSWCVNLFSIQYSSNNPY